jgi:1-deoxy-D-xylulose-5-phosphate synthase
MEKIMQFAAAYPKPLAFRYPRGVFMVEDSDVPDYELGKAELLREGEDILLIGYGNGVGRAIQTAALIDTCKVAILDLRFVKPLDEEMLRTLSQRYKQWFVFSDSVRMGGVGSAISEFLAKEAIIDVIVTSFEYPDDFIAHGNTRLIEESLEILPEQLAEKIKNTIEKEA